MSRPSCRLSVMTTPRKRARWPKPVSRCAASLAAGPVRLLVVVFVDEGQQVLAAGEGLLGFDFGAEPGVGCA
jgi:hypothetical protein